MSHGEFGFTALYMDVCKQMTLSEQSSFISLYFFVVYMVRKGGIICSNIGNTCCVSGSALTTKNLFLRKVLHSFTLFCFDLDTQLVIADSSQIRRAFL